MPESPLTPTYTPAPVETRWTAEWERRGLFRAEAAARRPFVIVMPPPNITGSLHLGHALNNTLQDILIRWRRMSGDAALWVPGTDHAGIATQNVVERQLMAEKTTRQQLGREEFVKRVWQWRNESGRAIIEQLKRLGASCDWSREAFTMDEPRAAAVRQAFVGLHRDGLIYRGQRLINWCPRCHTALSDIEVEHEETRGKMYHIKYPLADDPAAFLTVATTRPETLLGDTAVAVHPDDPRFNRFIGRQARLPLTGRTIPIVGDAILVDREFGTGAVKITPAHDFNDEKAGQRHNLPSISILDEQARIRPTLDQHGVDADVLGDIAQLPVPKARARIEHWLQERGLLLKVEEHTHSLGKCYRCKTVVEPFLSPQWFVGVNTPGPDGRSLAGAAIETVKSGRIRFIPEGWANNYFGWMEQIEDWCISRQIWWGHQIPAWYCRRCNQDALLHTTPDGTPIIGRNARPIVGLTAPDRCPACGGAEFVQEPDVLDTWFSSGLWPFSTLGWPKETDDLKTFYPTSVLVTSFDIIFFWVARMIMMGLYVMKEIPFRDVYIHALVRDAEGQKMSKSKGNVIDPLEIMNRYGTDALRFTLASMASPGRDIKLAEERIAGYRNFANKIWNAARFVLMNLPPDFRPADASAASPMTSIANVWIQSRLHRTIGSMNQSLEAYRFDEAAAALYQFIWHEFCDWYLELLKVDLQDGGEAVKQEGHHAVVKTFEAALRLLHPFMPFISEELWAHFTHDGESVAISSYPQADARLLDGGAEGIVSDVIIATVVAVRNFRGEMNLSPGRELTILVNARNDQARHLLGTYAVYIQRLARVTVKESQVGLHKPKMAATVLTPLAEIYIPLDEEQIKQEIDRLRKALLKLEKELDPIDKKFQDRNFVTRAPKEAVDKLESQRAELQTKRDKITTEIEHKQHMLS